MVVCGGVWCGCEGCCDYGGTLECMRVFWECVGVGGCIGAMRLGASVLDGCVIVYDGCVMVDRCTYSKRTCDPVSLDLRP